MSPVIAVLKSNAAPLYCHSMKVKPSLCGSHGFLALSPSRICWVFICVPPELSNVTVWTEFLEQAAKTASAVNRINKTAVTLFIAIPFSLRYKYRSDINICQRYFKIILLQNKLFLIAFENYAVSMKNIFHILILFKNKTAIHKEQPPAKKNTGGLEF